MPGGKTPICNDCGISLCWDISDDEYLAAKEFWDAWLCQDCNGGTPPSLKQWHAKRAGDRHKSPTERDIMSREEKPIWDRVLTEVEWTSLLADEEFRGRLIEALTEAVAHKAATHLLVVANWPREAHAALFAVLPSNLRAAFDLAVFRPDGSLADLDETEGFRIGCGWLVDGPAGFDSNRLTPHGEPMPLGPYADLVEVGRMRLPLRLERHNGVKVRIHALDGDVSQGVYLAAGRQGAGSARANPDGSFTLEAFDEKTLCHVPTEEKFPDLDTVCAHFMEVGRALAGEG